MQFEPQAFFEFYQALKSAISVYGNRPDPEDYGTRFHAVVSEIFSDEGDRERLFSLGERIGRREPLTEADLTLEEVGKMKIICDAYFLQVFNKKIEQRKRRNQQAWNEAWD
jgi:hypothetical protein